MIQWTYIDRDLEPFSSPDDPVRDRKDNDSTHDGTTVVHVRLGHWHGGWPGQKNGNVDSVAKGEKVDG